MLGTGRKRGGRSSTPGLFEDDGRKLVLHVGCGTPDPASLHPRFHGTEWREVRLDIDPEVVPDIVADIIDMPEVPTQSVDAVWSSHNIEHVFTHEVPKVLGEFYRVLRDGGEVLLATPDLQWAAERIATGRLEDPFAETDAGPITPLDMVYGHTGFVAEGCHFMAHRTGFTARTLGKKLRDVGFADVDVRRERRDHGLWASGRRAA
jgi:SAM-dependent methyltransferase